MELTEAKLLAVVKQAIEEKHTEFWVDAEQHYLDHSQLKVCREQKEEWMANHEFMSEIRGSTATIKKISLRTAIVVLTTGALAWVAWAFQLRPPGQ